MKPRDTRPGAVALDAASRKVTTPGVVPRPPTVDDDATVPRRILEIPSARGAATEPMAEPPSGARGLHDTGPALHVTLPEAPHARLADTAADIPRRPSPSAASLLASNAVTPPAPPNVDPLADMARLAKATPVIPERADSDGAKNARFATEGVPARAAKVTMPTGAVILEPDDEARAPAAEEANSSTAGPKRRRAALPTAPSGRVLEMEDAREFRREGARGVVAGVSIALALLAALLIGTLVFAASRRPTDGAIAPPAPIAPPSVASVPHAVATWSPPAPLAVEPSITAVPPQVPPAPAGHRTGTKASSHPTASALAVPTPTAPPPASAQPTVARPVPTDITHDIN